MMKRGDYLLIADAIHNRLRADPTAKPVLLELAFELSDTFMRDRTNFDYSRFMLACGLTDERLKPD